MTQQRQVQLHLVTNLRHKRSKGQGLSEYALTLALVTLCCIVILMNLGSTMQNTFNNAGTAMENAVDAENSIPPTFGD